MDVEYYKKSWQELMGFDLALEEMRKLRQHVERTEQEEQEKKKISHLYTCYLEYLLLEKPSF